jgi:hypothetical protein
MLLSLNSDFHDYYDHTFAGSWQSNTMPFYRMSRDGLDRKTLFEKMESRNLATPFHGTVTELRNILIGHLSYLGNSATIDSYMRQIMNVVVYHDVYAHGGEGKELINAMDAARLYPNLYASQYIPANPKGLGESLRYLRIGARQFWLRYQSSNDWRSNAGNVKIKVLSEMERLSDDALLRCETPLLAIDFIRADKLYAIDYNTSPGIKGTTLEEELTPQSVYQQIEKWFKLQQECSHELLKEV